MSNIAGSSSQLIWRRCELKEIFHQKNEKMKILTSFTRPQVIPNLLDFYSSSKHKWRSFWWNLRDFSLSIDSLRNYDFDASKKLKYDLSGLIQIFWKDSFALYDDQITLYHISCGKQKLKHIHLMCKNQWGSFSFYAERLNQCGLFSRVKQVQLSLCLCSLMSVYTWIKA